MSVRSDFFSAQADTIRALVTGTAATDPDKIIVFHIDTETGHFGFVETTGGLDEWHRLTHCDLFDVTTRQIKGRDFTIFLDDLGLFKEGTIVSATDTTGAWQFVGSLVIANRDNEGNTIGLTPNDMETILNRLKSVKVKRNGEERETAVLVLDELPPSKAEK